MDALNVRRYSTNLPMSPSLLCKLSHPVSFDHSSVTQAPLWDTEGIWESGCQLACTSANAALRPQKPSVHGLMSSKEETDPPWWKRRSVV
eukprot:1065347-Pelagomonas_calceolata.AAC.2